ncbi:hypothetical protein D3C72_2043800 [compost metagenome]
MVKVSASLMRQSRVARPPSDRLATRPCNSAEANCSLVVAAPKATRAKWTWATIFRALWRIRLMASSRMSWAVGSSSRSRPDMMAPAGLMKSWHSLPAMKAASSAPPAGRLAAGRSAEGAERSGKVIVRAVCWREWLRLT